MLEPVRFLLELPGASGRAVYDALLRPGALAHPDRLVCPAALAPTGAGVSELAHERGLGLPSRPADPSGWMAGIDWASPLHRLALLPREVLESLAWYLGLAGEHQSLRQIVLRDSLQALQANGVSGDHLAFVYGLPTDQVGAGSASVSSSGRAASATNDPFTEPAYLPARIIRTGWGLISADAASLPHPLSWRLTIKLPPEASPEAGRTASITPGDRLFEWVRAQVVTAWQPEFDARLAAFAATRG